MADDHDATRGSREIHEQRTPLLIKETRLGDKGLSSVLVSSWPALSLQARATSKFGNEMNYKGSGKVHFGVDDVSLYGTPKEEPGPGLPGQEVKQSFLKNQLQALFQPTDNKLAMKLFGSKKALMKERIRQKAAGHWPKLEKTTNLRGQTTESFKDTCA
ncbi:Potassium/sodium hyperpolarization-activated cyclic nucleotide-gated channel 2 [Melipona quadrifasciata]|uniref:Potassium/sodium hyperpolarization-activated cyclic nucleotide-gated channel 2 n=1 Tax=Melipona quadrifasciata TaxID=166423 RepID=A0A0M9A724_9HYME|nr:Potassium/sodium hyperpolarization-activated cyclic nucleotide-gated channel 2 [Melipona quadrifasciata]